MSVASRARVFFESIEALVWKYDIEYIDAVVMYCEKNGLEIESVASLIRNNEALKAKVQIEAENLNYLPKSSRLNI